MVISSATGVTITVLIGLAVGDEVWDEDRWFASKAAGDVVREIVRILAGEFVEMIAFILVLLLIQPACPLLT